MFSNFTVGLLFGIGIGAWVFARLQRSTGGNTKNAVAGAAVVGIIGLIFMTLLLGMFFK